VAAAAALEVVGAVELALASSLCSLGTLRPNMVVEYRLLEERYVTVTHITRA